MNKAEVAPCQLRNHRGGRTFFNSPLSHDTAHAVAFRRSKSGLCRRSAPTQSLQKHLAAGKPVALAAARAGAGAGAALSHLLLQRGGETFLHELCPLVHGPKHSEVR